MIPMPYAMFARAGAISSCTETCYLGHVRRMFSKESATPAVLRRRIWKRSNRVFEAHHLFRCWPPDWRSFPQVGAEALERVAQALGARCSLPTIWGFVREGIRGREWQLRHASISALGNLAEGEHEA